MTSLERITAALAKVEQACQLLDEAAEAAQHNQTAAAEQMMIAGDVLLDEAIAAVRAVPTLRH